MVYIDKFKTQRIAKQFAILYTCTDCNCMLHQNFRTRACATRVRMYLRLRIASVHELRLQSPLTSHGTWLINKRVHEVVCPVCAWGAHHVRRHYQQHPQPSLPNQQQHAIPPQRLPRMGRAFERDG